MKNGEIVCFYHPFIGNIVGKFQEEEDRYVFKDPMQVLFKGDGTIIKAKLPFEIFTSKNIVIYSVDDQILDEYNKLFSNIVIPDTITGGGKC
jgi:hypothetical protein